MKKLFIKEGGNNTMLVRPICLTDDQVNCNTLMNKYLISYRTSPSDKINALLIYSQTTISLFTLFIRFWSYSSVYANDFVLSAEEGPSKIARQIVNLLGISSN